MNFLKICKWEEVYSLASLSLSVLFPHVKARRHTKRKKAVFKASEPWSLIKDKVIVSKEVLGSWSKAHEERRKGSVIIENKKASGFSNRQIL